MKTYIQIKSEKSDEWNLIIIENGKMKCDCLANLYNKKRETESNCKHTKLLKEVVKKVIHREGGLDTL